MRIRLKFVYKVCPAPVFIVRQFGLKGFMGNARGLLVLIRRDHIDDAPLIEHELTHVRQFYRLPVIHSLLYLFSKWYRLRSEVEAYKNQLSCYAELGPLIYEKKRMEFAKYISTDYGLNIIQEEAEALLTE